MNSYVTNETAIRLKASGFLVPPFAEKQYWFDRYGNESIIVRLEGDYVDIAIFGQQDTYQINFVTEFGGFVFAPTDTDILKLMPDAALTFFMKKWVVIETATGVYLSDYNDNPAEAGAEAWLLKNENKP